MSRRAPEHRSSGYLLLAACDIEPLFVGQSHDVALEAFSRDLQDIARLGFDSVMLRHVDERDQLELLDRVREAGLGVAFPPGSMQHYARSGSLPKGTTHPRRLPSEIPQEVVAHPGLASFVVEVGASPGAVERGNELYRALGESGLPCVLVGENVETSARALTRIGTAVAGLDSGASPLEPWLARFHEGLAAGRTAGVVFDRYRRLPGDGPGIASGGDVPAPARTAAITALTTRAKLWGPRLQNLTPVRVEGGSQAMRDLVVTAFIRGRLRYALVFNRATQGYTRGDVVLPDLVGGFGVARAVEVPPSKTNAEGRVLQATDGRIVLPVILRPGDAALFELF